ncbi:phosphomevalonate kinase [Pediococcus stilesii]|uniref:phosphomevalonate kinase n=1 Tax=Pediococcus stilesii TaxID=331679 RepID=A0A0R2L004_9LACO|nr:phosphomevalonate kinase [Pediococcus stilesii]KRN95135.1 phosphomevalonate kinase [Pediococcus stilesii]TLQ04202.1 phosphomevalonate kinase [Pediococcus stilesii]
MIKEKAPGKLYIAGEYAVVEPGNSAIIVAVNQFVTASIEASDLPVGNIISKQYQNNVLSWRRRGSELVVDNRDNPYHYILSAISIIEELAILMDRKLKTFNLYINSDLDSSDGKKYGLGSSAAVTVATIKAVAKFYNIQLTKELLFKLASIAHLDVQGNGSLGDIAASVYGGWIAYQSFNRDWLNSMRRTKDLEDILRTPWPQLKIELLTLPSDLKLLIGWTGSPASTSDLVDQVATTSYQETDSYHEFLNKSAACLRRMIVGFHEADSSIIKHEISNNRRLLQELSLFSGVQIETDALSRFCDIAEKFDGAAKSSGAGGGDCGIVIMQNANTPEKMINEWRKNDIQPLNLDIHHVTEIN